MDKTELIQKYPIRNFEFLRLMLLDTEIRIGIPICHLKSLHSTKLGKYDPGIVSGKLRTAWTTYGAYKDALFRWVTVDGKQAPVYCVYN